MAGQTTARVVKEERRGQQAGEHPGRTPGTGSCHPSWLHLTLLDPCLRWLDHRPSDAKVRASKWQGHPAHSVS